MTWLCLIMPALLAALAGETVAARVVHGSATDAGTFACVTVAEDGGDGGVVENADSLAGVYLNMSDWFSLRRLVEGRRNDLSPFMACFSDALLCSWLNRPEQACDAIGRLLSEYGTYIDGVNRVSMTMLLAMNLEKSGRCAEAAAVAGNMAGVADGSVPADYAAELRRMEARYGELARYDLYVRSGKTETEIPFRVADVGDEGARMIEIDGRLNGRRIGCMFDTGAGVNVVTPRVAEEYGLDMLDAEVAAEGVDVGTGRIAVARELVLGGVRFRNVPFYVLDMSTGNEKADAVLSELDAVIGVPVMERLGCIEIDFGRGRMKLSENLPDVQTAGWVPMHAANSVLHIEVERSGARLPFALDTGSCSSHFDGRYYAENRDFVDIAARRDTVSLAGFGGTATVAAAVLPRACFDVGGRRCCFRRMAVYLPDSGDAAAAGDYGVFGIDLLLRFDRVWIDMKSMCLGVGTPIPEDQDM